MIYNHISVGKAKVTRCCAVGSALVLGTRCSRFEPCYQLCLYSSNYNDGINGYIQRKQYVGDKTFYDININGEVLKCTSISNEYNQGDCVKICVDRDNIVFFPL